MIVLMCCALTECYSSTASEVENIIRKVNTYWQANHPAEVRAFWDNAAYHTGNMEVYKLLKDRQKIDAYHRKAAGDIEACLGIVPNVAASVSGGGGISTDQWDIQVYIAQEIAVTMGQIIFADDFNTAIAIRSTTAGTIVRIIAVTAFTDQYLPIDDAFDHSDVI